MDSSNKKADQILSAIRIELGKSGFDDDQSSKALTELKILARSPAQAKSVYTRDGIETLAECAFSQDKASRSLTALEASRIIANALLLQDQLQQVFVDLGYGPAVVQTYSKSSYDNEFVAARILFLLTYRSKLDFVTLIEAHDLATHIFTHLDAHATAVGVEQQNVMQSMALLETLKLLYNLASKYPEQMHFFSPSLDAAVTILNDRGSSLKGLQPPIAQVLNVLAVIDWSSAPWTKAEPMVKTMAETLVHILDQCISTMKRDELETQLIPLVTVIRKANALALPSVKTLLRDSLLPQESERDKPLGQSTTLASRLLKLQTSGGLTVLPDAISSMLYDLSDRDATKFVQNIGYGHAAGYLMTHKIALPQRSNSGDKIFASDEINPVTGQRLDAEPPVTMPPMTEAEKEREAERLYVLFERMRTTGVMKVENPLRTAQESGRFEELSDSDRE